MARNNSHAAPSPASALKNDIPPDSFIYKGRPDLERVINSLVLGTENGDFQAEGFGDGVTTISTSGLDPEVRARSYIAKAMSIYTNAQLFSFAQDASNEDLDSEDPLNEVVNEQGVLSLMEELCYDSYSSYQKQLEENFQELSTEGYMTLDDFDDYLRLALMSDEIDDDMFVSTRRGSLVSKASNLSSGGGRKHSMMFAPKHASTRGLFASSYKEVKTDSEMLVKSILQGNSKFGGKNWGMLYCGGSAPVVKALKEYKRKYGVSLSVERFAW